MDREFVKEAAAFSRPRTTTGSCVPVLIDGEKAICLVTRTADCRGLSGRATYAWKRPQTGPSVLKRRHSKAS